MLDLPGKPPMVCSVALLHSLIANAGSLADPRSTRPIPPGQDASSGGTTTPGSSQRSTARFYWGQQLLGWWGNSWTGWSLELGVGIDPEQQSRSNPAGDVNGRVGFGVKF